MVFTDFQCGYCKKLEEELKAIGARVEELPAIWRRLVDAAGRITIAEAAAPGAVGLQTLLPAALRLYHQGGLTLPQLFRAMALNPARRLGLSAGRLSDGAPADLVLFDPDAPFVLDRFALRSKSKNTPFDGARMEGRVIGTWVGGQRVFGGDHD